MRVGMPAQIIDFPPDDEELVRQAAWLLVEGFREHWPNAWPDLAAALKRFAVIENERGEKRLLDARHHHLHGDSDQKHSHEALQRPDAFPAQ